MRKKGESGYRDLIFILLNIVFFSIIFVFVYTNANGVRVYEEYYSKKIALAIDSAEPGMKISLYTPEIFEIVENDKIDLQKAVTIKDNFVNVRLSNSEGRSYEFFSNYKIDLNKNPSENYLFLTINKNTDVVPSIKSLDSLEDFEGFLKVLVYASSKNFIGYEGEEERRCSSGNLLQKYSIWIPESINSLPDNKPKPNPILILALMMQEDNCKADDTGDGSVGVMQITKNTFDFICKDQVEVGGKILSDFSDISPDGTEEKIRNNIFCGVRILQEYYNEKGLEFSKACEEENRNRVYSGWSRALRNYVGYGCAEGHDNYVENIIGIYDELNEYAVENA